MSRCSRCVMDNSDPDISFVNGICNHCIRYDNDIKFRTYSGDEAKNKLSTLIKKIKSNKAEYNCLIGVSGGVDSTYVAYLVKKKFGLKPLAVHIDNGWNSNLANVNIENTLKILDIPLITHVLKWKEFKNLQIAFLKSGTPDGEIPSDHAINSVMYRIAKKYRIKYIINGMNFKTESMHVDKWAYGHSDWKYIKAINTKFGTTKLESYPHFSLLDLFKYIVIDRIKVVSILNYIDFDKNKAVDLLKTELNWTNYGGKHYESVYTRFFQGYWLVKKFNIDKRKGHLSDLIRSGQIKREQALEILKSKPLTDDQENEDVNYVIKKLGLEKKDFLKILEGDNKFFVDYPNSFKKVMFLKKIYNKLRNKNIVSR